jgi:Transposase
VPKRYQREFRRAICDRLVAGERVSELSEETGISPATLHLWKHQGIGQCSVSVISGMLVAEGSDRAHMSGSAHQLCQAGPSRGCPGESGVPEIMEVEVGPPGGLPRLRPDVAQRPARWVTRHSRSTP